MTVTQQSKTIKIWAVFIYNQYNLKRKGNIMKRIDVIPLIRVNGVKFGMNRSEVRAVLGEASEFFKTDSCTNTTDDFGYCHVFYDNNDRCEAIEIFDDAEVYINDKLIFPINKEQALNSFRSVFDDFIQDDDGLISYKFSIGIYAPYESMESILIGKENYYDESDE